MCKGPPRVHLQFIPYSYIRNNCFFQAEDGIRDFHVTGVQTCALPISEKDTVEWVENKGANIAAIKAGIPAYGEWVVKYIRNGKQLMEVELGEPVIVAVADRELPWGFFNFPSIRRAVSGQISVSWSMSPDNANSYGQATTGNSAVSSDEGKTWTRVERAPTGGGIVLSNGDRITITTPTAIPLADLDLPPVLATMQDGSNYNRLFRI